MTKVYTIDSFLSLFFFDAYQLTLLNHRMVEADFFFGWNFPPLPCNFIPFFFLRVKKCTVKFKPLSTAIPKLFNEYETWQKKERKKEKFCLHLYYLPFMEKGNSRFIR